MSKSSALSIRVILIFEMQLINGALFLKANFLSYSVLFGSATVIVPLTTIYASLLSQKPYCNIGVLNLICLFVLYILSTLPD